VRNLAIVTEGQTSAADYFVYDAMHNCKRHTVFGAAVAPVPLDDATVVERLEPRSESPRPAG
jgi:hypothetical protein